MEQITFRPSFDDWQRVARAALHRDLQPDDVIWAEIGADQPTLDMFDELAPAPSKKNTRVPKAFLDLSRLIALHRDPRRWALLYRIVWRLTHGETKLLDVVVDKDVALALSLQKAVRHDVHKMRAFVRFREIEHAGEKWFVAWFEPEHHIVEHNAAFFVDRFASMRWAILTPDRCAHWDGREVKFTDGVAKSHAPRDDEVEPLWLTYYANIFNPARVKVHAMEAEMPKKYWHNLPEAALISPLLQDAPRRVEGMIRKSARKAAAGDDETEWRLRPCRTRRALLKWQPRRGVASPVICISAEHRQSSARDRNARKSCFSASSRAIRRMSRGSRSSDRLASFSTARWVKPGSTGTMCTSRTQSNTSNGNRAVSDAFTRNQIHARSQRAVHGWKRNCDSCVRSCWCALVRLRRKQSSARRFESRATAARCWIRHWQLA